MGKDWFGGAGEGREGVILLLVLEYTLCGRRVENALVAILRRRLVSRTSTAISTVEKLCVHMAQV